MTQPLTAAIVVERLKYFHCIDHDDDLAEFLGITPAELARWVAKDQVDIFLIVRKCTEIDFNWLFDVYRAQNK